MKEGTLDRVAWWIWAATAAIGLAWPASAQPADQPSATPAAPQPNGEKSLGEIEAQIKAALDEISEDFEKSAADALRSTLNTGLGNITEARANRAEEQNRRAEIEQTDVLAAQLRETLAHAPPPPSPEIPPEATLSWIEQQRGQAKAALENAGLNLTNLQTEQARRQKRQAEIPALITASQRELETVNASLHAPQPAEKTALARKAEELAAQARQHLLRSRIAALHAELEFYQNRRDVFPMRIEEAERSVSQAEALFKAWESAHLSRVKSDAEAVKDDAMRLALETNTTTIGELAEEADQDVKEITAVTREMERAEREIDELTERAALLQKKLSGYRARIADKGLTNLLGGRLRGTLDELPSVDALRQQRARWQDEAERIQYLIDELKAEKDDREPLSRRVEEVIHEAHPLPEHRAELEKIVTTLISDRDETRSKLTQLYANYLATLESAEASSTDLIRTTTDVRDYIEENVLWIRSVRGPWLPSLDALKRSALWLTSPANWLDDLRPALRWDAARVSLISMTVAAAAALWWLGIWCRHKIRIASEPVAKYSTDAFVHTLRALVFTLMAALPLPVTIYFISEVLFGVSETEHGRAVQSGFQRAAFLLLAMGILRHVLRDKGLADAHFRWPAHSVSLVRRHLGWFMPVAAALSFIITAMGAQSDVTMSDALGRVCFIAAMIALAIFHAAILNPRGAALGEYMQRHPAGWLHRLRWVLYVAAVAFPAGLALVALVGYYYTATQLEHRMVTTLAMAATLTLVFALLLRWLFIERRRMAVDRARKRAQARQAEQAPEAASEAPKIEEKEVDLPAMSAQTRQLIRVGIILTFIIAAYLVWAGILPALRMFDRVQLWPDVRIIELQTREDFARADIHAGNTGGQDIAEQNQESQQDPTTFPGFPAGASSDAGTASEADQQNAGPSNITLADIGIALLITLVVVVASKNLPGLLEFLVLQKLPIDAATRFAITTIARYAIIIAGISAAFGAIGISWSTIQWLAAALTFGLAFGLQEIFANFVSGLIILIERPIHVGDIVTVGDVSGRVANIKMRATTIVDWDRKELILPNKSFITDRVINWTLSDNTLRVVIPVGVAYGSDTAKVHKTLLDVAANTPNILTEPPPMALFLGFGDSTLNFELRVFIPHIDYLLTVKHDLHMNIDQAFRKADIEIAFPQQDLHIRSGTLPVELLRKHGEPQPDAPPSV